MFDILEADIVVMQELKIQRKDLRDDMVLLPGWDVYYSLPKHKKGIEAAAIGQVDHQTDHAQDTRVWPSTRETLYARLYEPKKALLAA